MHHRPETSTVYPLCSILRSTAPRSLPRSNNSSRNSLLEENSLSFRFYVWKQRGRRKSISVVFYETRNELRNEFFTVDRNNRDMIKDRAALLFLLFSASFRVSAFSVSLSFPLLVVNPSSVLFSRFSVAHGFADSRDCVMHMQLHLASEYASPITAVKLDCRRLSTTDRPNKTGIFSTITTARSLLFAFFSRFERGFFPLPLYP